MTMHPQIGNWLGLFLALMTSAVMAFGTNPKSVSLAGVPGLTTSSAVLAKALVAADGRKGRSPRQFAVSLPVDIEVSDGRWSQAGELAVWNYKLVSPTALAVSLEFTGTMLPAGAALWLFDASGGQVRGPYTAADIASDGSFWSPLIRGDTVVVQIEVPTARQGDLALHLVAAHHAYRNLGGAVPTKATSSGNSGSCEINIVCPAGGAWQAESRAVAMITIGGNFECTATLLNDVPQDNTPYLLTANHCGVGTAGNPASSVTAYWNYQSTSCGGTVGSIDDTQTGATLIANDTQSDFTLLRLNAQPSVSFNVYYAGWDVRTAAPQSGVTIHHPQNDIKKISTYVLPATATQTLLGTALLDTAVWAVNWSQGVTEEGSSGSPLFNQNHAVVGQLAGGDSDCANPGGTDYYGRLSVSWNGNATSNAQIKPYLDPANSGVQVLCGRNAADPACAVGASSGGSTTGTSTGATGGGGSGGGTTGTTGGTAGGTGGGTTGTNGGTSGGTTGGSSAGSTTGMSGGATTGGGTSGGSSSSGGGAIPPEGLLSLALLSLLRQRARARRSIAGGVGIPARK